MAESAVEIRKVRERLAELFSGVDGLKSAFAYMPRGITTAHLPAVLIIPAAAEHSRTAGNFHRTDRRWRAVLLVAKSGEGIYGDAQKALEAFFERVEDLLFANMKLDDLDGQVYYARIISDVGEAMVEFPPMSGDWYLGSEWALEITLNRRMTAGR